MNINGIDTEALEIDVPLDLPPMIAGRVLQVDADQACYLAGCYDDEPFAYAKRTFASLIETWRLQAGAEKCILHLTGDNKGGRFTIATVKQYQANRKGPKPLHLPALRAWVQATYTNTIYHHDQEADDGMAQANYAACTAGDVDRSVICTADKDLRMCSGRHLDQKTGELILVNGYGSIYLTEGKSRVIKGYGTSFFWAQLLMGDIADNIPGLVGIGPTTLVKYPAFHTKALEKLLDQCESPDLAKSDKAAAKIESLKHKSCGAVAAYTILENCTNDLQALNAVVAAYRAHYGTEVFEHISWDGTVHMRTEGHMLLEQAKLLWMRRVVDESPIVFFKQAQKGEVWDDRPDA